MEMLCLKNGAKGRDSWCYMQLKEWGRRQDGAKAERGGVETAPLIALWGMVMKANTKDIAKLSL